MIRPTPLFRSAAFALSLTLAAGLAARPWPGLTRAYLTGFGCVFLLLELTPPGPGANGRVAFTHNEVEAESGLLYFCDFTPSEWGQSGFNGTGINYASGEAWAIWSTFWAPWGNWW